MGVSLGKTHYCLRALTELGWIKANRFRQSADKLSYAYLLTPAGLKAKAQLTASFLERKVQEFEALKREIATLQSDLGGRRRLSADADNPEHGR